MGSSHIKIPTDHSNRSTAFSPSLLFFSDTEHNLFSSQFRATDFPPKPTSNPPPQARIDTHKPEPMPTSNIAKRNLFVFFLALLASTLFPSSSRAQLNGNPRTSPLETLPPTTLLAPTNKVIAVILPKALDAKKIKPGDTFAASIAAPGPVLLPEGALIIRVIDTHPAGDNTSNSRLVLQFEPPGSNSASASPLRLELQALAASSTYHWFPSPINVDRFPCDPKVFRAGCNDQDKEDDDIESQIDKPSVSLCKPARTKDKSPAHTCDDFYNSHGIYGYRDLSLAPPAADSANTSTIISTKKNIKLESGTILILSGPDAARLSKHFRTLPWRPDWPDCLCSAGFKTGSS
jgi:hypothetical protein